MAVAAAGVSLWLLKASRAAKREALRSAEVAEQRVAEAERIVRSSRLAPDTAPGDHSDFDATEQRGDRDRFVMWTVDVSTDQGVAIRNNSLLPAQDVALHGPGAATIATWAEVPSEGVVVVTPTGHGTSADVVYTISWELFGVRRSQSLRLPTITPRVQPAGS